MNRSETFIRDQERVISRQGGKYFFTIQLLTELISFSMMIIWSGFMLVIGEFNPVQMGLFLISSFIFLLIKYSLMLIFTSISSSQARMQLDVIYKGKTIPPQMDENQLRINAWNDAIKYSGNFGIAELVSTYILVVLPVVIIMITMGHITPLLSAQIAVSGVLSGTLTTLVATLFVEQRLTTIRKLFLEKIPSPEIFGGVFIRIASKTLAIIITLILASVGLFGLIGYQSLIDIRLPGSSSSDVITRFTNSIIFMGILLLLSGIVLSRLLSRSVTRPIEELANTINLFQGGKRTQRASTIGSDETGRLTIRLNQLLEELQASQTTMEKQVDERTSELVRRTLQLQSSAQVAREAASVQDVNELLARTVDMISSRFSFYHVGIFLLDDHHDYAILRAASSEGGKTLIQYGHKLPVGQQGIVGAVAYENRSRVAMDVGTDSAFSKNPALPQTQAEAAFPLSIRNQVIGVLDIQSTTRDVFSQSDVELLQALADQIALAIQNARLIDETRQTLRQLEVNNAATIRRSWGERAKQQKRIFQYTPTGVVSPSVSTQTIQESTGTRIEIPILLRGQKIGMINLVRREAVSWDDADRALAQDVSNQIALALENARLLDDARQRALQEQTISALSTSLSGTRDPDDLLQTAVKELHQLPNVEEVAIFIGAMEPPAQGDVKENPKMDQAPAPQG